VLKGSQSINTSAFPDTYLPVVLQRKLNECFDLWVLKNSVRIGWFS